MSDTFRDERLRKDIEDHGSVMVREDAGCCYDMNEVEKQPRVRAGQWVSLPNGERVVLRTMPKAQQPTAYTRPGTPAPELLFYRYRGGLHMAAINGYSIIGLVPLFAADRGNVEAIIEAIQGEGAS